MKKLERQIVEEVVDCDTEKLYGPIAGAIEYLQEIAAQHPDTDISLEEHWYRYQDMNMRFVYSREETDAEYEARYQEHCEKIRQTEEAERYRKAVEHRADVKEFERLQHKLGR